MKTPLYRRPAVHVFVFGLALALALYLSVGPPKTEDEQKRIVVSDSDIEQLRITWYKRWQRNPTPGEMQGLLQQFIREEVLYREALARGYDKDDQAVRRAMQQKMEFLGESQVWSEPPTDQEINAYFSLRREQYRVPPAVSFAHLYFNLDRRGSQALDDIQRLLVELGTKEPDQSMLTRYGDPFMLRSYYAKQTEREVRSEFGQAFADSLMKLPSRRWLGPIPSSYGAHLVYVFEKDSSYIPALEMVRGTVIEDMISEAKKSAKELFYTEILRGYRVVYRGRALEGLTEEGPSE